MKRLKPDDGLSLDDEMELSEEERRQARIGVATNVGVFAAVVLALRLGNYLC